MHIVLFPMFLCRVLVRLWVVGFESDFGVVVRVRWPIDAVPAASVQRHFSKPWSITGRTTRNRHRVLYGRYGTQRKGTHVYHTLNYNVTPETIPDASTLDVDDINWTITPPLPSGIGYTPQLNQPKLSGTPVRCTTAQKVSFDVQEQLNETIGYEQDEQTDLLCDSLADISLENRHLVQKLHDWGKALRILPLDNIARELFLTLSNGMISTTLEWRDTATE